MQYFSIEPLGDGQTSVESNTGVLLYGGPAAILPDAPFILHKTRPWTLVAGVSFGSATIVPMACRATDTESVQLEQNPISLVRNRLR
jgi:hypothetical protein